MAAQAVLGPQVGVLHSLYPYHVRKSAAYTGRQSWLLEYYIRETYTVVQ